MTIEATTNRVSYLGNGVTTAFAFAYPFHNQADLVVIETIAATGAQTTKTLTTDYTISGTTDAQGHYPDGGTINAVTAPASTVSWTIYRDPSPVQRLDLVQNDDLPAESVESALDYHTLLNQRTRDMITRSLRQPEGDSAAIDRLPPLVDRISKYLAFDASGDPIAVDPATASGTSVTTTGTSTARLLADRFADFVNVKDYGAVGDGVTSDQTAVAAAVAAGYADGRDLYWPDGTYLTTATIPNFHDVRHRGPGAVKRGSTTFYVEPAEGQTNTLYVATTGSNTNDGLTSSEPTLTIQQAVDYLAPYAPLKGAWTISIAAGTYAEAVSLPDHTNFQANYLTIKGPSVATVQTTPTAIIDYPGSGTVGMDLGSGNKVKVMDIKFTDWLSPAVTGLNVDDNSILWAYNVHASYCRQGIVANAARLYVQGGILHGVDWTTGAFPAGGGSVGVVAYAGTVASIGYGGTSAATGTIIENFAQAGYEGKSGTHVVSSWVTYQSNEVAVWLYTNSRFDDRHNIYKKNELVYLSQKGFISRDSVLGLSEYNFGTTYAQAPSDAGDGNFEIFNFYQYSAEEVFAHPDAIGGLDITKQRQSTEQTGTIASTLTRTLATIYAGTLQSGTGTNGKYLEVFLTGASTGAAGTKTVLLKLGGTTVTTLTIPTGTQTWSARITIWASNTTSVIQFTEATTATIGTVRSSVATVDAWVDNDLEVWTTIPGAADTATLHEVRVIKWG